MASAQLTEVKTTDTRPLHNSGASVPDTQSSGLDAQPATEWLASNGIDCSKQIRTIRLVHMRYQHPNLGAIIQFLQDFGMDVVKQTPEQVWLRGSGPDPYVYYAQQGPKRFLGGTFSVESEADLIKASKLEGATGIKELNNAPGGGSLVTALDPEGVPINLMHGQELSPPSPGYSSLQEKLVVNYEEDKPRKSKFHRFNEGPAAVYKVSLPFLPPCFPSSTMPNPSGMLADSHPS